MSVDSQRKSIKDIFPEIDTFEITVVERVPGSTDPLSRKQTTYKEASSLIEKVACSWSQCHNGGVRIGDIIREMVAEKKEEYENTFPCGGYWGSPKGKVKYESCGRYFTVKASAKYK